MVSAEILAFPLSLLCSSLLFCSILDRSVCCCCCCFLLLMGSHIWVRMMAQQARLACLQPIEHEHKLIMVINILDVPSHPAGAGSFKGTRSGPSLPETRWRRRRCRCRGRARLRGWLAVAAVGGVVGTHRRCESALFPNKSGKLSTGSWLELIWTRL